MRIRYSRKIKILIYIIACCLALSFIMQVGINDDTWLTFEEGLLVDRLFSRGIGFESYTVIGFISYFFVKVFAGSSVIFFNLAFFVVGLLFLLKSRTEQQFSAYMLLWPLLAVVPLGSLYVDFLAAFIAWFAFARISLNPSVSVQSQAMLFAASILLKPTFGVILTGAMILFLAVNRRLVDSAKLLFIVLLLVLFLVWLGRESGFVWELPIKYGLESRVGQWFLPFKLDGYLFGNWNVGLGSAPWIVGSLLIIFNVLTSSFNFLKELAVNRRSSCSLSLAWWWSVWFITALSGRGQGGLLFLLVLGAFFQPSSIVKKAILIAGVLGMFMLAGITLLKARPVQLESGYTLDCSSATRKYIHMCNPSDELLEKLERADLIFGFDDSAYSIEMAAGISNLRSRSNFTYGISCGFSQWEVSVVRRELSRAIGQGKTVLFVFPKGDRLCRDSIDSKLNRELMEPYQKLFNECLRQQSKKGQCIVEK